MVYDISRRKRYVVSWDDDENDYRWKPLDALWSENLHIDRVI